MSIETYVIQVDQRHQSHYQTTKGAHILHYLRDAQGELKGIFNGGQTARRWIRRYAGTPQGVIQPIQFVKDPNR